MDPTTIMAVVSCGIVFCGWLVLPHRATPDVIETLEAHEPAPALEAV